MTTPSTPTAETKSDFDPQAPCIGSDGLEYEDFAARLEGRPKTCWRNDHIRAQRQFGVRESVLRAWIKAYDEGEDINDGDAGSEDDGGRSAARYVRANFAVSAHGEGLIRGPRYRDPPFTF